MFRRLIAAVATLSLAAPALHAQEHIASTDEPVSQAASEQETAQLEASDSAEDAAEDVSLEEEAEEDESSLIAPFSASFSVSNMFSVGAIARSSFEAQNYNLLAFSFGLGYATPVDGLSLSLGWGLSKFLSESGGSTRQREVRVGDLRLGANWSSFFYDEDITGLRFSAGLGLTFPTSESSRFTNLRTAISPSLSISRAFGDLSLSYRFSFRKNFHRDTSVVADLEDYRLDVIARDGGTENVGAAQIALDTGVLTEWSVSNSFTVSYTWIPGLSSAIGIAFADFFTYDNGTISRDDEFTSEFAVPGRGHGQSMTGFISVSYAFLDYFSADITLDTTQEPLTADNQRVRFPFWDTQTGNLQNTTLAFTLGASY
ncbi:MAG: hypothetical protein KC561_09710 [Myxococcales bacterium]|nr:hypothetical protein [Myxococcales bacterium]